MKYKYFALVVAAGTALAAIASLPIEADNLSSLAEKAMSPDADIATAAIASLRARGLPGVDALLDANAGIFRQYETRAAHDWSADQQQIWERAQDALSRVSGQRDCQASRLFWFTDFDQAKAAARASGKPILSLRLLGRLDEEYSCANSRFFRTTLYANTEVSQYLRDHFILHWKSVRPVPRITIDFGDGRKIDRTITGNSIHYILDADGRPIDALPGLYGPKAFLKGLAEAEKAALDAASLTGAAKEQYLRQYHDERYAALLKSWKEEAASDETFQTAADATWEKLAGLRSADAQLDRASTRLIAAKNPTAAEAMGATLSKTLVERPLVLEVNNLQRSIAEDTVRNEYLFHSQIHQWLADDATTRDVDQLNRRVYATLFLTPDSDPWLGLVPANTFTGLANNGLVQAAPSH